MTLTRQSGNQEMAAQTAAQTVAHPLTIGDRAGRAQAVRPRPQLAVASAPAWKHQLILKGRLDSRTVAELEDEIECLCEEGVTILTLDLRQLDAIDPVGARAIASGGVACKERGRDFAVVPGSSGVRSALAEIGAEGLLSGDPVQTGALALAASASNGSLRGTSTVMVKNL